VKRAGNTNPRTDVILAIDDDREVLDSVKHLLESEGYAVLAAADPVEGIRQYEAHWRDVKLVLLDFMMHIMRGDEVFDRLQEINPNVRAILLTSCDNGAAGKMLNKGLRGFLPKPVVPEDLIGRVRAELDLSDHRAPGAAARQASRL